MAPNPLVFDLDDQPVLEFTILNTDGTAYDLTGASVDLLVEGVGSFVCDLVVATDGTCSRTVDVGDFPEAGRYRAQLRVAASDGTFHSNVFVVQVAQAIDSTNLFPVPPTLSPLTGGVIFGDNGQLGQDVSNFFWDDTNKNLRLFGGTIGTNGTKVVAFGVGAEPTTFPSSTVQVFAKNLAGAGTHGLWALVGTGGGLVLKNSSYTLSIALGAATTFTLNENFLFVPNSNNAMKIAAGTNTMYQNFRLGDEGVDVGTNAEKTFLQTIGVAPTTSPANAVQETVVDLAGAGTAGKQWRDETGHVHQMGRLIQAQVGSGTGLAAVSGTVAASIATVGTPANTTETILHTLTFPANSLTTDGQGGKFWYIGALATNGNTKTVRLRINGVAGTTLVDSGAITTNNADWQVNGRIVRTAANTAVVEAVCLVGPAGAAIGAVSVHRINVAAGLTPDMTAAITLDLTGQNGSSSANDITCVASRLVSETI